MSFGGILKQSTAVDVLIGPFVDSANGDDEETGLTIAQADVRLSKNGQTAAQKNDNTTCAHDADGFYNCELDATDTNTVGQLTLYVHVAGALAVRHDYHVVEEAIYDALYGASATGLLPANVTQIEGADPTDTIRDAVVDDATRIDASALNTATGTTIPAILDDTDLIDDGTSGLAKIATDVAAILVDTAEIGAAGAGLTEAGGTGDHLTALPWNASWDAEVQSEVQDALDATLADSVPADGTRPSLAQAIYMINQFLTERSVSSTTVTVKKVDGSSSLMTFTLDSATAPTSITRTT